MARKVENKVVLHNTLGRQLEEFVPIEPARVKLYTCGPTVYNFAHIGNLRTYIFEDSLRRTFEYFGYDVHHVMNITDVGHLSSDADSGEDKMELGAKREGKSVWDIARHYENAFFKDIEKLNILRPNIVCRATEHVPEMIDFIQKILDNGYAYVSGGNVYFSVDRFPRYGELAQLKLDPGDAVARVSEDSNKRNVFDFVLWFTRSKHSDQEMLWDSPWGRGFPGWHIECSTMATKYLGEKIDIHCGGVDHISVHHSNEIAQSEAALGHRWVNYWLHGEFLNLDSNKMAKSGGEFLTLSTLESREFSPIDYRYFCLGAHYRSKLQFSWNALISARNTLFNLKQRYLTWEKDGVKLRSGSEDGYLDQFNSSIADDIGIPQALAVMWAVVKDPKVSDGQKRSLLLEFDKVFGLGISSWTNEKLPEKFQNIIKLREVARANQDFDQADRLRKQLLEEGVIVKDTSIGTEWHYIETNTPKNAE
jgi:cysteinyl-tRNA synthetase